MYRAASQRLRWVLHLSERNLQGLTGLIGLRAWKVKDSFPGRALGGGRGTFSLGRCLGLGQGLQGLKGGLRA